MNEITIEQVKDIENRTERIELLHKMILTMKLKSFDFAVSIGEELTKQKEELPHGTFIKWIESNLPFMSRMTANNYIRVFENREMLRAELGERLELNLAYKWLNRKKKPKQVSKQDSVKEKVDSVLKDSIKENRKKISKAKRKALKGEPLLKTEKKLLLNDTSEKKAKLEKRIQKARESLEKLEQLLEKLEM